MAFSVSLRLERNIDLYPKYRATADAMAWLPVFFLYFSERLTLAEVLLLEAVYYVAVVIIEVPSGYMSDVLGRRRTLLLSSLAVLAAYVFFLMSGNFFGLATGQFLLAASIALRSGTDTAFHYESLHALDRESEYGDREAIAGKYGFASTAIAALAGGIFGSINLSLPYWLSLMTACVSFYVVYCFFEPEKTDRQAHTDTPGFINQLRHCLSYLKQPLIKWIFGYTIFMYAIVHIPYEFYQPYLGLLDQQNKLAGMGAPLIAGIVFALTAMIASISSAYSMDWQRIFGLTPLLMLAALVELAIIVLMAAILHPLIAVAVILRSGPMAVIQAPVNAALAPLIANDHRATFLSIKSLAARLVFAMLLLVYSFLSADEHTIDWNSLSLLLKVSAVIGITGLISLYLGARHLSKQNKSKQNNQQT